MNESNHESSQRKVVQNMHFLYAAALLIKQNLY